VFQSIFYLPLESLGIYGFGSFRGFVYRQWLAEIKVIIIVDYKIVNLSVFWFASKYQFAYT